MNPKDIARATIAVMHSRVTPENPWVPVKDVVDATTLAQCDYYRVDAKSPLRKQLRKGASKDVSDVVRNTRLGKEDDPLGTNLRSTLSLKGILEESGEFRFPEEGETGQYYQINVMNMTPAQFQMIVEAKKRGIEDDTSSVQEDESVLAFIASHQLHENETIGDIFKRNAVDE